MTESRYCQFVRRFFALLCAALPLQAGAADWAWLDDVQVHGFLSQGFIRTDHNNFFGDSESGSFDFTEIGVNASVRPLPSLLLTGQILSRNAGEMYDFTPQVDYALANWAFVNREDYTFSLSLGRQKNPIGLFNETRDVASTRPGIFVPQAVYFDKVRNLVLASDGVGLNGDWFTDAGVLQANMMFGTMQVDTNVEYAYLGGDFPGTLKADGPSLLGRVGFEDAAGEWQLAVSGVYSEMQYDAAPVSPLQDGSTDFYYWVLSAQYAHDNWSVTGEYAWEPITWSGYGAALPDRKLTGVGWYLQGDYDLRHDLSVMLRYESALADKDDPKGLRASAASGGFLPPFAMYTHTWATGLRWDVNPKLMLRFEYQRSTGTHVLSGRENPIPAGLEKEWQLFSVLASYRF